MSVEKSQELQYVEMAWIADNKQYGTLNDPVIMVGDDFETYHVKFNKPTDNRIGINEIICSLVGLELELPLFNPIIAKVSQDVIDSSDDLENYSAGEHFAQVYREPFETVLSYIDQGKQLKKENIGNIGLVPDFIAFDKYIENFDRHGGNVCLLPNVSIGNKVDYYLFDHDLAFQRTSVMIDISNLRSLKTALIHMCFIVDAVDKSRLFYRGASKINTLESKIPDLIKQIPKSWVKGYESYISNIETLLTTFTESMVYEHIELNKGRFPKL